MEKEKTNVEKLVELCTAIVDCLEDEKIDALLDDLDLGVKNCIPRFLIIQIIRRKFKGFINKFKSFFSVFQF